MLYYCTEKIRLKDRAEKILEYLNIHFFISIGIVPQMYS